MRHALVVLLAMLPGPLLAQTRLRVDVDVAGGVLMPVGNASASYRGGPFARAGIGFRHAGSPLSLGADVLYGRLAGADVGDIRFPALSLLAFSATVRWRLRQRLTGLAPFLAAGSGVYNVEDALPFAAYQSRAGVRAGGGLETRVHGMTLGAGIDLTEILGASPRTTIVSVSIDLRYGR